MDDRRFPIIEIFGPVLEGEGFFAGAPTIFIRFGGCDYRCSWCDSMYAVLPDQVKLNSKMMDARQILNTIRDISASCKLITFSGGNPALQHLDGLIDMLHDAGYQIKMETQGSVWRDWIDKIDHVVVSPKPPSSNNSHISHLGIPITINDWARLSEQHFPTFQKNLMTHGLDWSLKIVVFDLDDILWAKRLVKDNMVAFVYLSCGTKADDTRDSLGERYAELGDIILREFADLEFVQIRFLPQLHVFAHLHARGV